MADSAAVQELIDRQRIWECLLRYTRGMDRLDRDLVLSAYHEDAMEDHGAFMAPRSVFVDQVMGFHREKEVLTQHIMRNHACELEGDVAHCETYVSCYSVNPEGAATISYGRFVDRLEKRDGRWGIVDRVSLNEGVNGVNRFNVTPPLEAKSISRSARDKSDPVYMRPLRINR